MRLPSGLVLVGFCLLSVLVYYGIMQEITLWKDRNQMQAITEQVQKAERQIVKAKEKIQELSDALLFANNKKNELVKIKTEVAQDEANILNNLQACNTHKAEDMKSKKAADENLQKLKADEEREKKAADEEIRRLNEQISEREKKLCQLVDVKNEEARKLCGIAEAPK